MPFVIPQSDDRLGKVMLIADRTQARRAQKEVSPGSPASSPSQRAASTQIKCPLEKISTSPRTSRTGLTTRSARLPTRPGDFPPWGKRHETIASLDAPSGYRLCGVPRILRNSIRPDRDRFGHGTEAGQFAGAGGALQRTGEHLGGAESAQPFPEPSGGCVRRPRSTANRSTPYAVLRRSRRFRRGGPGK